MEDTDARAWKLLVNATRRALLQALNSGPRSIKDLADGTGVSGPSVSLHLGALEDAGLVVSSDSAVDARLRLYRLRPARLAELRQRIDLFWAAFGM